MPTAPTASRKTPAASRTAAAAGPAGEWPQRHRQEAGVECLLPLPACAPPERAPTLGQPPRSESCRRRRLHAFPCSPPPRQVGQVGPLAGAAAPLPSLHLPILRPAGHRVRKHLSLRAARMRMRSLPPYGRRYGWSSRAQLVRPSGQATHALLRAVRATRCPPNPPPLGFIVGGRPGRDGLASPRLASPGLDSHVCGAHVLMEMCVMMTVEAARAVCCCSDLAAAVAATRGGLKPWLTVGPAPLHNARLAATAAKPRQRLAGSIRVVTRICGVNSVASGLRYTPRA